MHRCLQLSLLPALLLLPTSAVAQQEAQVQGTRRVPAHSTTRLTERTGQTLAEARSLEQGSAEFLLAELEEGFRTEDARAISERLPETEIPFSLDPAEGSVDPTLAPLQSREQIYYQLRGFFERVEVESVECDCSEEDLGVEDAHGVLELSLADSGRSRLFVRLRRSDELWRVAELRALP